MGVPEPDASANPAQQGPPGWVPLAQNLIALVGAAVMSYGFGLAWRPAGFIFAGLCLFAVGVIGSLRSAPAAQRPTIRNPPQ